jgi:NodT family efflux transporter outer membrane factor (OMF) lipoprotein
MMKVYKLHKNISYRRGRHLLAVLIGAAVMSTAAGCMTVGPEYAPVSPDAPSQWSVELKGGLVQEKTASAEMASWWDCLNDGVLSSLEARVANGSLELKAARARLLEARALRGVSRASLFPTLGATGAITSYRTSENGTSGVQLEDVLYSAGFDAGWEVDLFGGVHRAVEASQANLEAAREDYRDVMVSMLAEVALNYIEVRTYQARLASTMENIAAQEKVYQLNRSLFEAGMISELAMQQSRYGVERSRAAVPTLESGLAAAKNRLAVLLGEKPGALNALLEETAPIPTLPATVAVGVPADTLRNRPDIRKAERQLAAQTARVGVATSDLYPKLRLAGTLGLESIDGGELLSGDSLAWSVGPAASWNIFNAGAVRQNIAVQSALVDQALVQYEVTVLQALEEIENVLIAYAKEQNRHEYLTSAITAARRADELAREQYQAGLVDFSNVLDTQQALLSLEDELAQNEGTMVSNLVRLYKAFGGGWSSFEGVEVP